jgi:hypothetical protein
MAKFAVLKLACNCCNFSATKVKNEVVEYPGRFIKFFKLNFSFVGEEFCYVKL